MYCVLYNKILFKPPESTLFAIYPAVLDTWLGSELDFFECYI